MLCPLSRFSTGALCLIPQTCAQVPLLNSSITGAQMPARFKGLGISSILSTQEQGSFVDWIFIIFLEDSNRQINEGRERSFSAPSVDQSRSMGTDVVSIVIKEGNSVSGSTILMLHLFMIWYNNYFGLRVIFHPGHIFHIIRGSIIRKFGECPFFVNSWDPISFNKSIITGLQVFFTFRLCSFQSTKICMMGSLCTSVATWNK